MGAVVLGLIKFERHWFKIVILALTQTVMSNVLSFGLRDTIDTLLSARKCVYRKDADNTAVAISIIF